MRWKTKIFVIMAMLLFCTSVVSAKEFPYKEVTKAAKKGIKWGGKKSLANAHEMFRLWYPIYWECGNIDMGYVSIITYVESAGNPWSRTEDFKDFGEVGLISVKRATARLYDGDACDPCFNVWVDTLIMKQNRETVRERYPFLKKYDRWESDLWADAVREAGPGSVSQFIKATGLLKNIAKVKSPYHYLYTRLTKPDLSLIATAFGKGTAAQAAFRFFWVKGLRNVAQRFGGGGKTGRAYMKKCAPSHEERPPELAPYPGDKEHGYCSKEMNKWDKPPTWRWKKGKSGWMNNRWKEFCQAGQKCTYEEVESMWFESRQAKGMLPTDEQYKIAREKIELAGCWPPGL